MPGTHSHPKPQCHRHPLPPQGQTSKCIWNLPHLTKCRATFLGKATIMPSLGSCMHSSLNQALGVVDDLMCSLDQVTGCPDIWLDIFWVCLWGCFQMRFGRPIAAGFPPRCELGSCNSLEPWTEQNSQSKGESSRSADFLARTLVSSWRWTCTWALQLLTAGHRTSQLP